nr:Mobile element protein [Escherichia coli]
MEQKILSAEHFQMSLNFKWLNWLDNQEPLLPVLPGNTISMITSCSNGSGSGRTKGEYRSVFR